ncbi:MAG TPA: DUF6361 family protein, partial [Polyangiaceae bacterium]|nr:DUF6361 family protein [Polyangiaceae bacterium]
MNVCDAETRFSSSSTLCMVGRFVHLGEVRLMTSTFSWMDHSDRDRQRMLEAIDRFAESDTRDELGLGAIRDGFSDLFFPGTNTIQTRARYFLFVPWIYKAIQESGGTRETPSMRARRDEIALCDALCRSDDVQGVIGSQARGGLKRLPSNIYWLGLHTWGIRVFAGSQDDYHEQLKRPEAFRPQRDDDGALVDGEGRRAWDGHLPRAPKDFLKSASLSLTRVEAEYLRDRLAHSVGDSLLSHLVNRTREMSGALPWQHPQAGTFPAKVRVHLEHARLFSETMYGAALLYNLLLIEHLKPGEAREEKLGKTQEAIDDWCEELHARRHDIDSWDRGAFWQLAKSQANVRGGTERFVNEWWRLGLWR